MMCESKNCPKSKMHFGYRDLSPLVWLIIVVVIIIVVFFLAKYLIQKNNDKEGWNMTNELQLHDALSTGFYYFVLDQLKAAKGVAELTVGDQMLFDQTYMQLAHPKLSCLVDKLKNQYGPSYVFMQLQLDPAARETAFVNYYNLSLQDCGLDPDSVNALAAAIVSQFEAKDPTPDPTPPVTSRYRGLQGAPGGRRTCCG